MSVQVITNYPMDFDHKEFDTLLDALADLGEEQLVYWDRDVRDLSYAPTQLWIYDNSWWAHIGEVSVVAAHVVNRDTSRVRHVWCWRRSDSRWMLYCEHTRVPVVEACSCKCEWCQSARGSQDVSL